MAKRILLISLFVSLFAHVTVMTVLWLQKDPTDAAAENVEITQVTPDELDVNKKNLEAKQIVEQDEKSINDEIPDKEAYLSRNNQRVEEQTRAQNRGRFSNAARTETSPQPKPKMKKKQPNLARSKNGVLPSMADLTPQFDWNRVEKNTAHGPKQQASASEDYIKDVSDGPQTLLNTREFIYYTYYSRIKEKLRQHWEPKIKEKMSRIMRQGRQIASDKDRITKIIITLNAAGTLIGVQVLEESGVRDLDDAAIEAFRAAAPFPNPPKGIVEGDGTIKIRWDFILEARSGFPVRFHRQASHGEPSAG